MSNVFQNYKVTCELAHHVDTNKKSSQIDKQYEVKTQVCFIEEERKKEEIYVNCQKVLFNQIQKNGLSSHHLHLKNKSFVF